MGRSYHPPTIFGNLLGKMTDAPDSSVDAVARCSVLTRDLRGIHDILDATATGGRAATAPGRVAATRVVLDRMAWDVDRLDVTLAEVAARLAGGLVPPPSAARALTVYRWRTSGSVEGVLRSPE